LSNIIKTIFLHEKRAENSALGGSARSDSADNNMPMAKVKIFARPCFGPFFVRSNPLGSVRIANFIAKIG
jgi:hypothetical protein